MKHEHQFTTKITLSPLPDSKVNTCQLSGGYDVIWRRKLAPNFGISVLLYRLHVIIAESFSGSGVKFSNLLILKCCLGHNKGHQYSYFISFFFFY